MSYPAFLFLLIASVFQGLWFYSPPEKMGAVEAARMVRSATKTFTLEEIAPLPAGDGVEIIGRGAKEALRIKNFILKNPSRLVVDLERAELARNLKIASTFPAPVKQARVSRFAPGVVRVVLDLQEPVGYNVDIVPGAEGTVRVQVRLAPFLVALALAKDQDPPVLRLETTMPVEPKLFYLAAPARLVVDLPNTRLGEGVKSPLVPAGGIVKGVRLSQFTEETVRVVLDLDREMAWVVNRGEALEIALRYPLYSVRWEEGDIERGGGRLRIKTGSPFPARIEQEGSETLRLLFPAARELPQTVLPSPPAGLVREWSWEEAPEAAGGRALTLALGQARRWRLLPSSPAEVILELRPSSLAGRLVVVDPGHGGVDPGAIGGTGLMEKTVNLQMGLRLREKLTALGARVLMTREDDTFIPLMERPNLANSRGAEAFISLHCNSFLDVNKGGLETFAGVGRPESRALAEATQRRLLAATGLADRGVKAYDWLVVREAKMPAILIEVAFISNPAEEARLADPAFQEVVAEAVAAGVEDYFAAQEEVGRLQTEGTPGR